MSRTTAISKERLAAFVDGELTPEESAAMVMHLADHPQDQAYVDELMTANAALAKAFAAPMNEPVPDALRDLIMNGPVDAQVLPFRPKPSVRPVMALWGGLGAGAALAASLAVMVFLPSADPHDLNPGQLAASSPLTELLATLPSGTPHTLDDGGEVLILASVPTPTGFCREIEVIHAEPSHLQAALACTKGAGWTVEVVISEQLETAQAAEGFATASGEAAQGFSPFLERVGAGEFLTPEDEAAAIAKGWAN